MWAKFLSALISLAGILKVFGKALESIRKVKLKKKKDTRKSIKRQIEQAILEKDIEKLRELHDRLDAII